MGLKFMTLQDARGAGQLGWQWKVCVVWGKEKHWKVSVVDVATKTQCWCVAFAALVG